MADKTDKSKKRKRQADGTSKPSKKVAIEEDRNIKISLRSQADEWAPVIASTPGLAVSTSIALQPYTRRRANAPIKAGRSETIATTELLLQSSAHPKIDYTAREEGAGGPDSLLKHYVGVYDPETGKLEVLEARKMVVRATVRAHQAAADNGISNNMRELRNDLGQTFGTKKAKKAIASVTENAIGVKTSRLIADGAKPMKLDLEASAVLSAMAEANKGTATREQLAAEADAQKPRPKANLAATEVKDVYTIESLIGLEIFKIIPAADWQSAVKNNEEVLVSSKYVANRIQQAASAGVQKLKILRYILCLLSLLKSSRGKFGTLQLPKKEDLREALGGLPTAVVEDVKRKFTKGGSMSKYQQDLLKTHICALALLVDNFEVDVFDLRQDLVLEVKEMTQYFTEVGARITGLGVALTKQLNLDKAAAAQRKVAKLKLPLEFPKVSFGRK